MIETPLYAASREGHAVVAPLLLENVADVMAKSEHKRTALHLASMYGRVEVARVLLEHGAEVNTKDRRRFHSFEGPHYEQSSRGRRGVLIFDVESTPLGRALEAGHGDVARLLLEHGADRNIHTEIKQYFKSSLRQP
jgi:ankyrin repeat protein